MSYFFWIMFALNVIWFIVSGVYWGNATSLLFNGGVSLFMLFVWWRTR